MDTINFLGGVILGAAVAITAQHVSKPKETVNLTCDCLYDWRTEKLEKGLHTFSEKLEGKIIIHKEPLEQDVPNDFLLIDKNSSTPSISPSIFPSKEQNNTSGVKNGK